MHQKYIIFNISKIDISKAHINNLQEVSNVAIVLTVFAYAGC
jgi:hypothetical protein